MQTSYKATGVLAACAAGAAVTSVLGNGSFWGGMLQHGFIAATIGGLADWFAVTAIFRKPFGFISYRTEILVRNRPRIMQALTDFISKDLLSKENIMDTLRKQDFAEMLAAYLTQRGGRERIWKLVREFAECSSKRAELLRMVHPMEAMLKRELDGLDVEGFLRESLEVLKNEVLIERIAASFVPLLRETFTDESVQQEILTHIRLIKERYEEGAGSRSTVFEMANLTDEKLLDFLNSYAIDWLNTLEHGEGEARDRVIYSIGQMVSSALDNKTLFDNVRRKFHEKVDDLDFAGQAEGLVKGLRMAQQLHMGFFAVLRARKPEKPTEESGVPEGSATGAITIVCSVTSCSCAGAAFCSFCSFCSSLLAKDETSKQKNNPRK